MMDYFQNYKESLGSRSVLELAAQGLEASDIKTVRTVVDKTGVANFRLGTDWEARLNSGETRVSVSVSIAVGTKFLKDERTLVDSKGKPREIKVHIGDNRALMAVDLPPGQSSDELAAQTARLKEALAGYAEKMDQKLAQIHAEVAEHLTQQYQQEVRRTEERKKLLNEVEQKSGIKFVDD